MGACIEISEITLSSVFCSSAGKAKPEWFLQKDSEGDTPSLISWPSRYHKA